MITVYAILTPASFMVFEYNLRPTNPLAQEGPQEYATYTMADIQHKTLGRGWASNITATSNGTRIISCQGQEKGFPITRREICWFTSGKIQKAGFTLCDLADGCLFRTRRTTLRSSSQRIGICARFPAWVPCYQLDIARHPGSSDSCYNSKRVRGSLGPFCTICRCPHVAEFDRRSTMLGWRRRYVFTMHTGFLEIGRRETAAQANRFSAASELVEFHRDPRQRSERSAA